MQISEAVNGIKDFDWNKHKGRLKNLVEKKPVLVGLGALGVLLLINLIGIGHSKEQRIIERPTEINFQNGRILDDRESTFYYGKERLLSQKTQNLLDTQAQLMTRISDLEKKLQAGSSPAPVAPAPGSSTTCNG